MGREGKASGRGGGARFKTGTRALHLFDVTALKRERGGFEAGGRRREDAGRASSQCRLTLLVTVVGRRRALAWDVYQEDRHAHQWEHLKLVYGCARRGEECRLQVRVGARCPYLAPLLASLVSRVKMRAGARWGQYASCFAISNHRSFLLASISRGLLQICESRWS